MVDSTFLYIIGGIGYLVAGALYFEWRLRRLRERLLPDALRFISEAFFVEEVPEGGGEPRKRLEPKLRALAGHLADELTPLFVERALKTVKLKLPKAPLNVTGEGGQLDINAVLGLLPKQYQGIAALAMPFLGKLLGSSAPSAPAGGVKGVNPFLKELEPVA